MSSSGASAGVTQTRIFPSLNVRGKWVVIGRTPVGDGYVRNEGYLHRTERGKGKMAWAFSRTGVDYFSTEQEAEAALAEWKRQQLS